ncbi:hypothetical protein HDU98_006023 [Podochytrium sp. JEL0797]|nr:hypothetical protein HDU98_006023 [Podochytrium sp. JEL0797]
MFASIESAIKKATAAFDKSSLQQKQSGGTTGISQQFSGKQQASNTNQLPTFGESLTVGNNNDKSSQQQPQSGGNAGQSITQQQFSGKQPSSYNNALPAVGESLNDGNNNQGSDLQNGGNAQIRQNYQQESDLQQDSMQIEDPSFQLQGNNLQPDGEDAPSGGDQMYQQPDGQLY